MLGDLTRYRQLLNLITSHGYRFISLEFANGHHGNEYIAWLRHDVEIDLDSAQKMASVEDAVGIPSTYYICFDSPFFAEQDALLFNCVQQLKKMGRDVQPHIVLSNLSLQTAQAAAERATECAEKYTLGLRSFTLHAPGASSVDLVPLVKVPWIYEMIARSDTLYLSDSGCRWKWGDPFSDRRLASGPVFQLLIHPVWWNPAINVADLVSSGGDNWRSTAATFLPAYAEHFLHGS